jgi:hypothetical protein
MLKILQKKTHQASLGTKRSLAPREVQHENDEDL